MSTAPPPEEPSKSTAGALLGTPVADIAIDDLIQKGDYSSLTMRERSIFCFKLAEKLGLNPLTKPFDFIVLNNKLTLYANKSCADQLRKIHNITSTVLYEGPFMIGQEMRADVYCVKVRLFEASRDKDIPGRQEDAIGCLGITNKKDEELANAIMKCHTKALRRGTLAFCGLGFLDELEVESVKGLEGGVGKPRLVNPPVESFNDTEPIEGSNPIPNIQATPVAAKPKLAGPLPSASPLPSAQPAAPKLPTVLPAVKP